MNKVTCCALRSLFYLGHCFSICLGFFFSQDVGAAESVLPDRFTYCTVCHGTSFQGNRALDAPNLSILQPWYVAEQLLKYKKLIRGAAGSKNHIREMQQMVGGLDRDALTEISKFVGTLRPVPAAATIFGKAARGAELYRACSSCHGVDGRGNEGFKAPALAGQHDWYLKRQLADYSNGLRGGSEGDLYGAQMIASMSMLKDDQSINDVLAYISTLGQAHERKGVQQ